jgi:hypothetical protein
LLKLKKNNNNEIFYYYAAAAATSIAGILHLILASGIINRNLNTGIFFLVGGFAQVFWMLPMIKKWGKLWYYIGIGGTLVLIIIYVITRVPNPLTGGRALSINFMGVSIEVFQIAYIILTAIIIIKEKRTTITTTKNDNNRT